jgi:hypothetical protein
VKGNIVDWAWLRKTGDMVQGENEIGEWHVEERANMLDRAKAFFTDPLAAYAA